MCLNVNLINLTPISFNISISEILIFLPALLRCLDHGGHILSVGHEVHAPQPRVVVARVEGLEAVTQVARCAYLCHLAAQVTTAAHCSVKGDELLGFV